MIEWSEQHLMIRDAVRKFVEAEIVRYRVKAADGTVLVDEEAAETSD